MAKIKATDVFADHAAERYVERTCMTLSKKEIAKCFLNNNIIYFKKLSASKSMAYLKVRHQILKIIVGKNSKKIVTILPWQSVYKAIEIFICRKYDNRTFKVCLYPDCYMETGKPNVLTRIYELSDPKGYKKETLQHNHPFFNGLFEIAWNQFIKYNIDHLYIQNERKAGNETFEIADFDKSKKDAIKDYCGIITASQN